jgi:transcriptional regulator with GAF, ATPase, and Fis domain
MLGCLRPLAAVEDAALASQEDDLPFAGEYVDFAQLSKDELQAKMFELLTLVETSRELLRARDPEEVARSVLLSVIGVLGAGSACVLRFDPSTERLELLQQFGLDVSGPVEAHLPVTVAEEFVEAEVPLPFRADEDLASGPARTFLRRCGDALAPLGAEVICPLPGRRGLFGFLVLGHRLLAAGYSARDLEMFANLAELYVLALERAAVPFAAPEAARPEPPQVQMALAELRERYPPLQQILGDSNAIYQLFRDMVELADSRATVLIQGESGTGKELVARAIHASSPRRNGPFEVVDCSSIPRELIESELFGHVRGAFTGAVRDRRGAFDLAHHGTIFLDEIGEMTLASQTRLLRVLQEGKFRPVGGETVHSVDVRVIAATNVDLREAVARGEFRIDLFYRICVYPLRLPPLRARAGDIRLLSAAFLKRFYADYGLREPAIDPRVIEALELHPFPGNVRELQNIVEALAIRSRGHQRVTMSQLNEVFRSQRIHAEPLKAPPEAGPGPGLEEVPAAPGRAGAGSPATGGAAPSVGERLLAAWRSTRFNLLEASRLLSAGRKEGEGVAVADRAQLTHYLDGEILKAFVHSGSLEATVDALAAGAKPRERAERKVARVVGRLLATLESAEPGQGFPRLPREYRGALDALENKGADWVRASMRR